MPPRQNSVLPRSQYRDLYYIRHVGPLDATGFTAAVISSDSIGNTSLSTSAFSDSSSLSQATQGSLSSLDAEYQIGASFLFDKTTFLDSCMFRAENIATENLLTLRWLVIGPGQSQVAAWENRQFATKPAQIGDDSTSESSEGVGKEQTSYQPLGVRAAVDMVIDPYNNRIPAGGLLLLTSTIVPTNLVDLRLCLRLRETQF